MPHFEEGLGLPDLTYHATARSQLQYGARDRKESTNIGRNRVSRPKVNLDSGRRPLEGVYSSSLLVDYAHPRTSGLESVSSNEAVNLQAGP